MPSIFDISIAAFAIGMAGNAGLPNPVPPAQITVQADEHFTPALKTAIPVPKPKPEIAAQTAEK